MNDPMTTPGKPDRPPSPTVHLRLARWGWKMPLVMLIVLVATSKYDGNLARDFIASGLVAVGLIFGIVGLFGLGTPRDNRLLRLALLGILLNGFWLVICAVALYAHLTHRG